MDMLQVLFLLSILLHIPVQADIMSKKRSFCGRGLTQILGNLCLVYPSPLEEGFRRRRKRQVIKECCRSPCSLEYLLQEYCQIINNEALEMYKKAANRAPIENVPSEAEPPPTQMRTRRLSRGYRQRINEFQGGEHAEFLDGARRGKRNCSCQKHTRYKGKSKKKQLLETLTRTKRPFAKAKLGERDEGQIPFYIVNRYR